MSSMQDTKTLADGKLELTVVKFEPMTAYAMLGRLQAPDARTDPKFMRDMLANSSIVREDDKGARVNISLAGDKEINRAFRGFGVSVMLEALGFAIDTNFADFFDVAATKLAAQRAAATE